MGAMVDKKVEPRHGLAVKKTTVAKPLHRPTSAMTDITVKGNGKTGLGLKPVEAKSKVG